MNLHLFSGAKYRDGALNLTKTGINQIEGRANQPFGKGKGVHQKNKKTYEDIVKERDSNPEYMTGKKFKKKKGNVAKKFKGGKRKHKK